jgi:mRNA-degrading endonuclease RelE of RelBE toxin-antitoxin system
LSEPAPSYEVKFTGDAWQDIRGLDGSIKKPLKTVLSKKLAVDPESYGTPLRSILAGFWKHEFSGHRIIYKVYKEKKLVVVCAVGPRKAGDIEDVYKQLTRVAETGRLAEQVKVVLETLLPNKKK